MSSAWATPAHRACGSGAKCWSARAKSLQKPWQRASPSRSSTTRSTSNTPAARRATQRERRSATTTSSTTAISSRGCRVSRSTTACVSPSRSTIASGKRAWDRLIHHREGQRTLTLQGLHPGVEHAALAKVHPATRLLARRGGEPPRRPWQVPDIKHHPQPWKHVHRLHPHPHAQRPQHLPALNRCLGGGTLLLTGGKGTEGGKAGAACLFGLHLHLHRGERGAGVGDAVQHLA